MWPFPRPRVETKTSRAWSTHMILGQLPVSWSPRKYESFSKEAYQYNVIANSAINRLAKAVSSITWKVQYPDGRQETSHPVLDLLARPNPAQSGMEFFDSFVGYLMLAGNSYIEGVTNENRLTELWTLRPDRMKIIPSRTGLPGGFRYTNGNEKKEWEADPLTGESLINHTKLFHPTDDWYGLSPIEAAAYGIDQHNEGMTWIQGLLQNSARPSGALVMAQDNALTDEEFTRLKQEIEENYTGGKNAGRPMLLEGGLDWKQLGLSPMDMEILKAREMAARDISLAFGVPPLLLNIPGDNTYANYREARLGFYEDTVLPLVRFVIADLNHFLSPYFPDVKIIPDIDKIEAVAEKRMKMWAMADASDDITLNESREMKGLDPLPDPLGSTLMCEIRSRGSGVAGDSPSPELTKTLADQFEEFAYGPRN